MHSRLGKIGQTALLSCLAACSAVSTPDSGSGQRGRASFDGPTVEGVVEEMEALSTAAVKGLSSELLQVQKCLTKGTEAELVCLNDGDVETPENIAYPEHIEPCFREDVRPEVLAIANNTRGQTLYLDHGWRSLAAGMVLNLYKNKGSGSDTPLAAPDKSRHGYGVAFDGKLLDDQGYCSPIDSSGPWRDHHSNGVCGRHYDFAQYSGINLRSEDEEHAHPVTQAFQVLHNAATGEALSMNGVFDKETRTALLGAPALGYRDVVLEGCNFDAKTIPEGGRTDTSCSSDVFYGDDLPTAWDLAKSEPSAVRGIMKDPMGWDYQQVLLPDRDPHMYSLTLDMTDGREATVMLDAPKGTQIVLTDRDFDQICDTGKMAKDESCVARGLFGFLVDDQRFLDNNLALLKEEGPPWFSGAGDGQAPVRAAVELASSNGTQTLFEIRLMANEESVSNGSEDALRRARVFIFVQLPTDEQSGGRDYTLSIANVDPNAGDCFTRPFVDSENFGEDSTEISEAIDERLWGTDPN